MIIYNKTKNFVKNFYEITDDDSDRISKFDFWQHFQSYYKPKTSWGIILRAIKNMDLNYERKKRANGLQGCITNLKLK